jgi:hypothetical protein
LGGSSNTSPERRVVEAEEQLESEEEEGEIVAPTKWKVSRKSEDEDDMPLVVTTRNGAGGGKTTGSTTDQLSRPSALPSSTILPPVSITKLHSAARAVYEHSLLNGLRKRKSEGDHGPPVPRRRVAPLTGARSKPMAPLERLSSVGGGGRWWLSRAGGEGSDG